MSKMYRHDDYIEFKNCLLKMDESAPNYEAFSNTACLMEVLAEMLPFNAASGILTALHVVYNDDELDFILGFLSTVYESWLSQRSNDGIDRDSYNFDDDDDLDEFGNGGD